MTELPNHRRVGVVVATVSLVLLFYIGVPILILVRVIPWDMKFVALTVGAVLIFGAMRALGFSNAEMGITRARWRDSLTSVALLTGTLILAAVVMIYFKGARFSPTETWQFYVFYVAVSSPAQEFLYRGTLKAVFECWRLPRWLEYSLAALLFGFVHIIYRDALTVAFMIVMGILWYTIYGRTRSLLGVSVSHAILGVLTIATGIID